MITETVTRVILHCSRCNAPFVDDDTEQVALWTQDELDEAFPPDFDEWTDCQGWIRLEDRVLCFGCWGFENEDTDDEARCEIEPLPVEDAARVTREQMAYAHAEALTKEAGDA